MSKFWVRISWSSSSLWSEDARPAPSSVAMSANLCTTQQHSSLKALWLPRVHNVRFNISRLCILPTKCCMYYPKQHGLGPLCIIKTLHFGNQLCFHPSGSTLFAGPLREHLSVNGPSNWEKPMPLINEPSLILDSSTTCSSDLTVCIFSVLP